MKSLLIIITTLCVCLGSNANANTQLSNYISNAQIVGEGRLRVFFMDVYDAALYASNGQWSAEQPYALQLTYLRDIPGKKIAQRSIDEIRAQGFGDEEKLSIWGEKFENVFTDVIEGDIITGIYTKSGEAVFLKNGTEIGRISDKECSQKFFNIWLDQKTSAPNLRLSLLGLEDN